MNTYDPKRQGLEYLLDLDKETYEVGGGWWVTIRAVNVAPTKERPHGLQYSITLHNPRAERILGYDNAHPLPVRGRRARATRVFETAGQSTRFDPRPICWRTSGGASRRF